MTNANATMALKQYPLKVKLKDKSFTLRQMAPTDAPLLQQFALGLSPHDLLFMRRDITKPEGVNRWIDAVRRGAMHTILCEDAEGVAGYSSIHLTELDWSAHVGDLRVATAARVRGAGLGRLLTREAFNMALALGVEKVVARMTPDQVGARALFQELGFQAEALLKDEVRDRDGEYHDLLIMACNVETFMAQRQAFGVTPK
ncbi:MAG: GNAT family N-acetyltransferase [Gammaproteobacteria bacterium]|nr:GNAT family N-acetyltransferase [Gammaproteobacteria bacterium]